MASQNIVVVSGRLGADPEQRFTPSGAPVTTFNLAVEDAWYDDQGNLKKHVNWTRIEVWGKQGLAIKDHLSKGDKVGVNGKLRVTSDGEKYYTSVVANNVDFHYVKKWQNRQPATEEEFPF